MAHRDERRAAAWVAALSRTSLSAAVFSDTTGDTSVGEVARHLVVGVPVPTTEIDATCSTKAFLGGATSVLHAGSRLKPTGHSSANDLLLDPASVLSAVDSPYLHDASAAAAEKFLGDALSSSTRRSSFRWDHPFWPPPPPSRSWATPSSSTRELPLRRAKRPPGPGPRSHHSRLRRQRGGVHQGLRAHSGWRR
ncbi:hypothetical protein PVAP13_2KG342102 [Panicum virgatum]|uniref:Uncharacterized protein n=1 Tax=Panicum virgatum TaxID=38727 RepID=A0A8T0W7D4_PANVG|nr:hypothetical protein PVAP13_2KG342102 [Panicum virgatum]